MALSKMYTNFAAKLHALTAQSSAAAYLDSITDIGLNLGLRTNVDGADGSVYRSFGSLVAGAPSARITTFDLKGFLDVCGLEGMAIDRDGTHPGVVLYFPKMKQGGTRETGSSHMSVTIGNGIMVPRSIELSHQQTARLMAEIISRKEGAVAPVVYDEAVALPAIYPAIDVEWTLGKVDLNGTTLEGVESASIETGIDVKSEGSDSDIYPTFVSIREISPSITLRGRHIDITSVLTEDGAFYTATQVKVYARKRAEGGTFVADGTAEHIRFTLGKCRVEAESFDGDPKSVGIKITPWGTPGSTPVYPIAISTAAAIA